MSESSPSCPSCPSCQSVSVVKTVVLGMANKIINVGTVVVNL
ncbi:hypothetical protein FEV09_18360 [Pseudanabaena catenata USMAC16]|uniref:Uncharacterized protein n=1 Tax=Pseudanabaena catenata USMAC16 TaxID=1855837 RepID=A0A9X4MCF3_9CYAN|nr:MULTISPECIES: hypothetical protein [Pseudanabaena]MDG3496507.1 hypothetical protein [Pseudanabaena catenata USMAC16]